MNYPSKNSKRTYYATISNADNISFQVVRVALNKLDNDPQRFWKTFTTALFSWDVLFIQKVKQSGFPDSDKKNASFSLKLAEAAASNPLVLEIDGRHRIQNPSIQAFLKTILDIKSQYLFVLLLSCDYDQTDIEEAVRANKLRCFSEQEERDYYREQGVHLDPDEFRMVHGFTEGWAVSVIQLAQRLASENIPSIFSDFNAYIRQWIVDNYRNWFNEEERNLIICLALLDDFPMELVRDLAGWENETALAIFESTPFLRFNKENSRFSCGNELRLYSLKLISRFLTKKEQHKMLIRIGDWYREQGCKIDAVACYRKAGNNSKILQVIQQWVFPTPRDLAACYVAAIQAMPESFLEKNPLLYVICPLCLFTLGRYDEGEKLLEVFCAQNDQGEDTPAHLRSILGEAYIAWAHRSTVQCNSAKALQFMKKAEGLLPNGSIFVQGNVNFHADKPVLLLPSPEAGSVEKNLAYQQQLSPYCIKITKGSYAGSGNLATAEWHYFTRNFKEVEVSAYRAFTEGVEWSQYDIICSAYFLLMRFNLAKGNYDRMMENLAQVRVYAAKAQYSTFFTMPGLAESWLALKLGKHYEVAAWITDDKLHQELLTPLNYGWDHLLRSIYLLENESYTDVISYVNATLPSFQNNWRNILGLQMKLVMAFAYHYLDENSKAVKLFEFVYHWLHANNLIMLFIEFGSHTTALVTAYRQSGRGVIPPYWLDLLEKKSKSYQLYVYSIRRKHHQKITAQNNIVEQLTIAEQKILLLLADGLTAAQIASKTNRSTSTVNSMLYNIYSKIGVQGKAEAIRLATQANIWSYVRL